MRPLVKSAMQSSLSVARNVRKAEVEAKAKAKEQKILSKTATSKTPKSRRSRSPSPLPPQPKIPHADGMKEFKTTSSSAPRRLNDIAQAPPEFKQLPRGAAVTKPGKGQGDAGGGVAGSVVSMAQKLMMEQEREKAILRYRQLKASRRKDEDRE